MNLEMLVPLDRYLRIWRLAVRVDLRSRYELWKAAWQRLFGYDFFISYAWLDGRAYAEKLEHALAVQPQKYRCFIDQKEMGGGEAWRASVRLALRRSSVMVLIASPQALASDNVFEEISIFADRDRPLIPIDFGNRITNLSRNHRLYSLLEERLRFEESDGTNRLAVGEPSSEVMAFLHRSFGFVPMARRRLLILGFSAICFAALAAFASASYFAEQRARQRADERAAVALSRQLAAQSIQHANNRPDLALLLALQARRASDTIEARSSLFGALGSPNHLIGFLPGLDEGVTSLAFSQDGKTLASAGANGTIRLWNLTRRPASSRVLNKHRGAANCIAFSPDGRLLASGGADGTTVLWDVRTHKPSEHILSGYSAAVSSVTFSPDGRTLATGGTDGAILLWDVSTHQPLGSPLLPKSVTSSNRSWGAVLSLAFAPDGNRLLSAYAGGEGVIWELKPLPQQKQTIPGMAPALVGGSVPSLLASFSTDGLTIAWANAMASGAVAQDVQSNAPKGRFVVDSAPTALAFSPVGENQIELPRGGMDRPQQVSSTPILAIGALGKTVSLWNLRGERIGEPFAGHTSAVNAIAFSPDGRTLASGDTEGKIILRSLVLPGRLIRPLISGRDAGVLALAFSSDSRTLATGGDDRAIRFWDVATGRLSEPPLTGLPGSVQDVAFSPAQKVLASVMSGTDSQKGQTYLVRLWDPQTRRPIGGPLEGDPGPVNRVAFSPDGKTVASGGRGGVWLWNVETRRLIGRPLKGLGGPTTFSPDGEILVIGASDGTVRLWDTRKSRPIGQPVKRHAGPVESVAFAPNGRMLVSAGYDGTVVLWDASTRGLKVDGPPLVGLTYTRSVAFSRDGRLAVGSDHGTTIFDIATRRPLGIPLSFRSTANSIVTFSRTAVFAVAFSGDNKSLAIAGSEGIFLWSMDIDDWTSIACGIAARNLDSDEGNTYLSNAHPPKVCPPDR